MSDKGQRGSRRAPARTARPAAGTTAALRPSLTEQIKRFKHTFILTTRNTCCQHATPPSAFNRKDPSHTQLSFRPKLDLQGLDVMVLLLFNTLKVLSLQSCRQIMQTYENVMTKLLIKVMKYVQTNR